MLLTYTLSTLWHERQRFAAAVLAVAFSAALINLQTGLLFGLFATTSAPVDFAAADVWVGSPRVLSVDLGRPISEHHLARLAGQPGVGPPEPLLFDYSYWIKADGSKELCMVIGSRLAAGAAGAMRQLTPQLRNRLTEPGAVVVDRSELGRLGVGGVGEYAQINGKRVRLVGLVDGLKSLTGPYVFCSLDTARELLAMVPDQVTYLLARCERPADAPAVVGRLRQYADLSAFTRDEFSRRTRVHWLVMTNAGVSTAFTAALGLLVGAVVTSQTLYAAVVASLRQLAVLRAHGVPRRRLAAAVVAQAAGVGVVGVTVALPVVFILAAAAGAAGTRIDLPWELLGGTAVVTLAVALLAGLAVLRTLWRIEPATLLR